MSEHKGRLDYLSYGLGIQGSEVEGRSLSLLFKCQVGVMSAGRS